MIHAALNARPIIVALAGSNGAGKTTFYRAYLRETGLRFVNADDLSRFLRIDAYTAASVATALRRELVAQRQSFIFETVFSDPVADKIAFLRKAATRGYTVVLCYIGIPDADTSASRVSMRVSQGGHDVASDKIASRFPRTLTNLGIAIRQLPHVLVFDNGDLRRPFRRVAEFTDGTAGHVTDDIPAWLAPLLSR